MSVDEQHLRNLRSDRLHSALHEWKEAGGPVEDVVAEILGIHEGDAVLESLNISLDPENFDEHERECLRTYLESFLRGGGQFAFVEWSHLHRVTQDVLEDASAVIARERATLVQEIQVQALVEASEEANAREVLEQAAEELVNR